MIKIIFFFLLSCVVYAKEFKVSYDPDYAPFSYALEQKPYGLLIDIWKLWAKKNHHNITFVKAKSWDDAILLVREGKVDFFLGTTPYEPWMQGSVTYYKTKTAFFFLRNGEHNLKKIGIIGSDYEKDLQKKLPHAKIISYDTYEALVHALLQNAVDAIYDDALAINYFAIKHGYAHLIRRSNILSSISDVKAISAIKSNTDIFSQGFKNLSKKELEKIEANWIDDKDARYFNNANFLKQKSYSFIYHPHNKPLEFVNENGIYSGIIADLISLVASKSGLEFIPIKLKSWKEAKELALNDERKVEMISAIDPNDPLAKHYQLTQKDIFSFYGVLVGKKGKSVANAKNIGVTDESLAKWIQKHYPDKKVVVFKAFSIAMQQLLSHRIDLLATNSIKATYLIKVEDKKDLEVVKILKYKYHLKIAFDPKVEKELLSLVDESLSLITNKEQSDIYHKWMSVRIKKELDLKLIGIIIAIALGVIGIFIFINKQLNALVQQRTKELKELNESLEDKVKQRTQALENINKKMEENIRYAALIQNAILPSVQDFSSFFDEFFIIWEPKDIVGGDIYFFEKLNDDEAYLFIIDCTGHGVSGAFLTMLVKAIQEQLLSSLNQTKHSPAMVLEDINTILRKLLPNQKETSVGLDAGVVYINKAKKELRFAGANIPLYYLKEHKIHTLKPNRASLGYTTSKYNKGFDQHTIEYDKIESFYLTTDGFIDQNGGAKGFPFGKRQFFALLEKNYTCSMQEQKEILKDRLLVYQAEEERNDDITVIGFKL